MDVALLQLEDERRVPVTGGVDETLARRRHNEEPERQRGSGDGIATRQVITLVDDSELNRESNNFCLSQES